MSILEDVQQTVAGVLNVPVESVTAGTSQENQAAWDSFAHVNLVMALEQRFDVMLEVEEFMELTSVSAIVGYLERSGAA